MHKMHKGVLGFCVYPAQFLFVPFVHFVVKFVLFQWFLILVPILITIVVTIIDN